MNDIHEWNDDSTEESRSYISIKEGISDALLKFEKKPTIINLIYALESLTEEDNLNLYSSHVVSIINWLKDGDVLNNDKVLLISHSILESARTVNYHPNIKNQLTKLSKKLEKIYYTQIFN